MRLFYIFLTFFITQLSIAQDLQDGPYVSYRNDSVFIQSVEQGKVVKDSSRSNKSKPIQLTVHFPTHDNWNFRVNLKPAIQNEPSEFPQPEKLLVLSDIEGEFEGFRKILIGNGVIDESYNWTYGKGHVVICGDLFDRGLSVPETIWLMYKLELPAKNAGGYFHVILGNHDIMNLSGDLRYVQPKYLESAGKLGVNYMQLYSPDSELGRWLRSKNSIERIGDALYLHAGIAPQINRIKLSVNKINKRSRPYYDKAPNMNGVGNSSADPFFTDSTSLFWYRGYFQQPVATEADVDETLRFYKVKKIIVGHTILKGNIALYYNGKVIGIDVDRHAGDNQAALFENGIWYKVDENGSRTELK